MPQNSPPIISSRISPPLRGAVRKRGLLNAQLRQAQQICAATCARSAAGTSESTDAP
ncbi:MAG: hypothetical protein ACLUNO_11750 [Oscillospiraceae bacterium]